MLKRAPSKGWGLECDKAFHAIKEYVASPLSLSQPTNGEDLYLYLVASATTVSASLVRTSEDGKQKPVYFVSKVLTCAKTRYTDFERIALALRVENIMVDVLASFASNALYPCHVEISIMDHPSIYGATVLTVESQARHSWMSSISSYLRSGTLPEDRSEAVKVKARAVRYTLINDTLYKQSFTGPYQRCVPSKKRNE